MTIKSKTSYNITYDEMKDTGSGNIAGLLAKTILEYNLSLGLEHGLPFFEDLGVVFSNDEEPEDNLIVISINKGSTNKEDINISDNINEAIQFILKHAYDTPMDIRRIRAISKSYKKTQSYRKYLKNIYLLVAELPEEEAEQHVKDSLDFGIPYYIKVKQMIGLLSNLTDYNTRRILFYKNVWGLETIQSIFMYLTGERDLPEYITSEFTEQLDSVVFQTNLINLGISLGKGEFNKFIMRSLIQNEN